LARIHCPALIIVGVDDEVTPEAHARTMEKLIDRSRLVVLPGAGHLSNIEAPDAFSLALSDFLTSNM
jgi:pimeloyl-ACP methyl ester carboxylesterase